MVWPVPYGHCEDMRLLNETETINPITASLDILRGFQMIFQCYGNIASNNTSSQHTQLNSNFFSSPTKFINDMMFFSAISLHHILIVFILTVCWTLARHFFVGKVFMVILPFLSNKNSIHLYCL